MVGSVGTVSTGAIDPLRDWSVFCRERKLWFHVDGAYGAFASAVAGAPADLEGLRLADSVAVVIEVKSNLTSQWPKIRAAAAKVQSLKRDWRAHASLDTMGQYSLFDASKSRIPYLVVSFKGA